MGVSEVDTMLVRWAKLKWKLRTVRQLSFVIVAGLAFQASLAAFLGKEPSVTGWLFSIANITAR